MSELDYAWAAGFIDGEGTITLALRKNARINPVVSVGHTDVRALYALREMFGGQVHTSRSATERHKAVYRWDLSTNQAVAAIKVLRPYLRLKQAHADVVLLHDELYRAGGFRRPVSDTEFTRRLLLVHEIRVLNRRGPAA